MVTASTGRVGDEDSLAMTAHELVSILDLSPGDIATRTAGVLGLPQPDDAAPLVMAGVSTLLVRGLVGIEVRDDAPVVVPGEVVGLVGENLTGEGAWVELALLTADAPEVAYIHLGPTTSLIASPRIFATFELRFLRPEQSGPRGVAAIMLAFLEANAPAIAYAKAVPGDEASGIAVRLSEDGLLELSNSDGEIALDGTLSSDRERIAARIAEIVEEGISRGTTQ